jgi:predicted short-subunit dehydrogenase-like oxidoreductase (DUF2520 family)
LAQAGWVVAPPLGRDDDPATAARGVDLLVLAVPDAAIAEVAAGVDPVPDTLIVHLSGSLGVDVLAPHPRRGGLHPLVALPSAEVGARRLRGAWFAVAGDPQVEEVVAALDGRALHVAEADRVLYHAAACVASNHLVALLGQVERIAGSIGVPLAAYLDLVRATVENVAELGPHAALTGPAARGDRDTVERHRASLAASLPEELAAYDALVAEARRLAGGRGDATGRAD